MEVQNTSSVVQAYEIEVVGVPARFATVEPATLNLYPGTSGSATIQLTPPRTPDVRAGEYPMGVKVTPVQFPDDAVVGETTIQVLAFLETTAELIPRTSRGRSGAIHDLAIDNRGNSPIECAIAAGDADQALVLTGEPQSIRIDPGEARFAKIRVKPEQRLWRGVARTHPFQVTVTPDGGDPVVLDGAHLQEPTIPKWFMKALLALLAALLLLLLLWFTLLRPTIESAAQDAVADEVAAAEEAAQESQDAAQTAGEAAAAATEQNAAVDQAIEEFNGTLADLGIEIEVQTSTITTPVVRRVEANVAEGTTESSDGFVLGTGEKLEITDLVLENPNGDIGVLLITVDDETVLRLGLENFRSLDYHFVSPVVVSEKTRVAATVECRKAGVPPEGTPTGECRVSAFVGGMFTQPNPAAG